MKKILILLSLTLAGCATNSDQLYYETAKSMSRDQTMAQTACWAAVSEMSKNSDPASKANAIALSEKCKRDPVILRPPKKNWLGF